MSFIISPQFYLYISVLFYQYAQVITFVLNDQVFPNHTMIILKVYLLYIYGEIQTNESCGIFMYGPIHAWLPHPPRVCFIAWNLPGSILTQVTACCWWHQAITWTNVDLSSVRSSDIHFRANSQEIPEASIIKLAWYSIVEIRWFYGCPISTMGFLIPVR